MSLSTSTAPGTTEAFSIIPREAPPRDWRRAWRAIKVLVADSERTDQVFVLLDALGGPTDEADFLRYLTDPRGQRQIGERPDLLAVLSDRDALRALPEGSFGRTYLQFVEDGGLSADGLVEAEEAGTEVQADLDPDRRWLADRGRDSHDLWHVLTGYGRDEAGEVALLSFTYANYSNPGIALILLSSALIGPKTWNFTFERYLLQAYRRGRASDLDFAPYEEWLALPLDEVRRLAGIVPPELAHPALGIIEGGREGDDVLAFSLRSSSPTEH